MSDRFCRRYHAVLYRGQRPSHVSRANQCGTATTFIAAGLMLLFWALRLWPGLIVRITAGTNIAVPVGWMTDRKAATGCAGQAFE
jgi:hypothetical protein